MIGVMGVSLFPNRNDLRTRLMSEEGEDYAEGRTDEEQRGCLRHKQPQQFSPIPRLKRLDSCRRLTIKSYIGVGCFASSSKFTKHNFLFTWSQYQVQCAY